MIKQYYDVMRNASNDNALMQKPVWDGYKFLGFKPVKPNWSWK